LKIFHNSRKVSDEKDNVLIHAKIRKRVLNYIYIDESGDLGEEGSKYLVISALIISDPAKLHRIIKNMRRNKFKKQLRKAQEIKANKSSREIITHMLKKLNEVDGIKVTHMVLEKKKLFSDYLKGDKNKLYNYVAGRLARQMILNGTDAEIRIDKSKGKQILRENFNNYFLRNLHEKSSVRKAEIHHSYSQSWPGLQFADILAWACFQKFEHGNSAYLNLLTIEQEVYHVW
jgi:hypothetical protein